jgi:hypothetical protein
MAAARLLPQGAPRGELPFQVPPQLPFRGSDPALRPSECCDPGAQSACSKLQDQLPSVTADAHWPTDVFDGLALVKSTGDAKGCCAGSVLASPATEAPSSFERLVLRHSSVPMLVLWNVFLFWVSVAVLTHRKTLLIPTVVATAMGICTIVGITLNTNAYAMWLETRAAEQETGLRAFLREGPFSALRFFMIPFCVASYSGIVNQEAPLGTFTYLFPTRGRDGVQLVDGVPDTLVFIGVLATLTLTMRLIRMHLRRTRQLASEAADEMIAVENPL